MYPKFVHYKYYKKWIISEIHAHCKAILQSVEIVKNKTNAAHWSICSVVSCQNIFSFLWEMCRISKPIFQYITVCSLCVWGALNPTVLFSFPFWLFPSNPLCNSFFFFFLNWLWHVFPLAQHAHICYFFHLGCIYLLDESYRECKFSKSLIIPATGLLTLYLPQCVHRIHQ